MASSAYGLWIRLGVLVSVVVYTLSLYDDVWHVFLSHPNSRGIILQKKLKEVLHILFPLHSWKVNTKKLCAILTILSTF